MKMDTNLIAAFIVILFWGLWGLFFKIGISNIGFDRAVFWAFIGFLISDIFVIAAFLYFKQIPLALNGGALPLIIGGIVSALGTIAFLYYLGKVGVSVGVPMTALYPVVTTILAILVLKEKIKLTSAAGILLAIAAGVLLSL